MKNLKLITNLSNDKKQEVDLALETFVNLAASIKDISQETETPYKQIRDNIGEILLALSFSLHSNLLTDNGQKSIPFVEEPKVIAPVQKKAEDKKPEEKKEKPAENKAPLTVVKDKPTVVTNTKPEPVKKDEPVVEDTTTDANFPDSILDDIVFALTDAMMKPGGMTVNDEIAIKNIMISRYKEGNPNHQVVVNQKAADTVFLSCKQEAMDLVKPKKIEAATTVIDNEADKLLADIEANSSTEETETTETTDEGKSESTTVEETGTVETEEGTEEQTSTEEETDVTTQAVKLTPDSIISNCKNSEDLIKLMSEDFVKTGTGKEETEAFYRSWYSLLREIRNKQDKEPKPLFSMSNNKTGDFIRGKIREWSKK